MACTLKEQTMMNKYKYDPWGNLLAETETVSNSYRYAGYRWDKETGLYYLQARYYSPTIFRFLSKDKDSGFRRNPQSLNKYTYAGNNPLTFIEQEGQMPILAGLLLKGAAEGAVTSALAYAGSVYLTGQEWNWYDFGTSVLFGGAQGAVTLGIGSKINLDKAMALSAGASMAQYLTSTYLDKKKKISGASYISTFILGSIAGRVSFIRPATTGIVAGIREAFTGLIQNTLAPPLEKSLDLL